MFCNLLGSQGRSVAADCSPASLHPPSPRYCPTYTRNQPHCQPSARIVIVVIAFTSIPAFSQYLPCCLPTKTAHNAGTKYHAPPSPSLSLLSPAARPRPPVTRAPECCVTRPGLTLPPAQPAQPGPAQPSPAQPGIVLVQIFVSPLQQY